MSRVCTMVSLGLVLVAGCTPTVVVEPGGTTSGGTTSGGTTSGGTTSGGTTSGGTTSGGTTSGGTTSGGTTSGGTTSGATTSGGTTSGGTTSGGTTSGATTSGGTTSGGTTSGGTTSGGTTSGGTTSGGTTSGGTTSGGTTSGGTTGSSGPLVIAGAYDTTTQFNLLDALPPDVETALKLALELADSPGNFLLDMAGQIPVVKYVIDAIDLFSGVHDKITMAIDEYINGWSGGMVTTLHGLSGDLEMALRGLKAQNHLVISAPDSSGNTTVQDTLVNLVFTYNAQDYPYAQQAKAMTTGTIKGLKVTVAQHTYDHGVRIGGILVDLIDNVALPELTGVDSLGALLNQLVNCGGVADWVWSYIGNFCLADQCLYQYISANDLSKLCVEALDAAGSAIENQLASLDAPGMMSLSDGSCIALENKGHTGHADTLSNGVWSLTLPIGVGNVTLPGTFTGVSSN